MIDDLKVKREAAYTALQELRKKIDPEKGFSAENEAEYNRIDGVWRGLDAAIKAEFDVIERERARGEAEYMARQAENERGKQGAGTQQKDVTDTAEYREAFWRYQASGYAALKPEQRQLLKGVVEQRGTSTQVTTTQALGGYLVPTTFSNMIVDYMKYFGPMLDVCETLVTDSGNPILIPTVDDTATLANQQTTEGGALTVQDLTFGQMSVAAYTYAVIVKASEQELQDEYIGLEGLIARKIAERIGRKLNNVLTLGDNSNKPNGIITATGVGRTTASATAFVVNDLIDLQHSVDVAYRNNPKCAWQMHDLIAAAVRKLSIGTGDARWLWEPDLKQAGPDRLLGKPVHINNDMASALTSGQEIMLFGDHSQYLIRRVRNFVSKRLDERYADELAVGFVVATRVDGEVLNANGLKKLKLA